MKIVGVDNFGRESVADFLVCEAVANDYVGQIMVAALNNSQDESGPLFFRLEADDYRLWRGMEDLI